MRRYSGKFIFGFDGLSVPPLMKQMIVERRIGGVILFSRNIAGAEQLSSLCRELQELGNSVSELPLIIAVDQEGGAVNRVFDGVTLFPSPMAISATGNPEYARRVGFCLGSQLLSLGINMNLAPVLDINENRYNPIIGVRSFSDDPERVAEFGTAMIEGMEASGIASVAKHFPGIGFADADPHRQHLLIPKEIEELERDDLVPFRRAIKAGVTGIMVGHAQYPSVSQRPACLSNRVIKGLLRERLGYEGLVMTDDLMMEAISDRRSVGDAVVKACKAGADLVLVCHSDVTQLEALADFSSAIKDGKLRSGHLRDEMRRIRALRERIRDNAMREREDVEDGESLACEVAEAAITMVGDDEGSLPLRVGAGERLLVLQPELGPLSLAEDEGSLSAELADFIMPRHGNIELVMFEIVPSNRTFARVQRALASARAVVMGTCNAHLYSEQANLVKEVAAAGLPAVYVALRNPYDAELYPPGAGRLIAYGTDRHTLAAVGKAIFGELKPRGTPPVSLKL